MDGLKTQLDDLDDINKIAFPKYIGCGMAGGNWSNYYKMIIEFAKSVPYEVILVDYDKN